MLALFGGTLEPALRLAHIGLHADAIEIEPPELRLCAVVPGFSGVRLHLKFAEMLDHYRPGNAVRVKAENWTWISNTPEERVKSFEDRERSRSLRLPGQVVPEEKAR
mgnify:CR=1 FL=1